MTSSRPDDRAHLAEHRAYRGHPLEFDTFERDLLLLRILERAAGRVDAQLRFMNAPVVCPTGQDSPGLRCEV